MDNLVTQSEAGAQIRESGTSRIGIYPAFENRDWKHLGAYERLTVILLFLPGSMMLGVLQVVVWLDLRLSKHAGAVVKNG